MKILITGATGFIGSHVAKLLVREGHEVYATIRNGSDTRRIAEILPSIQRVPYDLLEMPELNAQLEHIQPELCIHLAWYAVAGKYMAARENLGMLNASLQLASKLASLGCRRFVGIGSCFEYDTTLGYLSENTAAKPASLYAASKLATQIALEQLGNVTGMSVVWSRLFLEYGPFEDQRRLMPAVICALLQNQQAKTTKGEQVRDYLHVEDVAAAIWAIAQSNLCGIVNVGSGIPVTVRDVVMTIAAILGKPDLVSLGALPYSASEMMFLCANNRLLVENTGWAPQYDLQTGLRHTIAWWQTRLGMR